MEHSIPKKLVSFFVLNAAVACRLLYASETPAVLIKKVDPNQGVLKTGVIFDRAEVEMTVDESGVPFSIRSSEGLPDSVVRAFAQWRYSPYKKDGHNVAFASRLTVPVVRTLSPAIERTLFPSWSPATDETREAIERGRGLNEATAAELESHLPDAEALGNPRASLLVYYAGENAKDPAKARAARAELLKWLVGHYPQDDVLGSQYAMVNSSGEALADAGTSQEVAKLWIDAATQSPTDEKVRLHALNFLQASHPLQALELLAKFPGWNGTAAWAGVVYGYAAIGVTALSPATGKALAANRVAQTVSLQQTARQRLLASDNAKTVLVALQTVRATADNSFCPTLLARAKELYPETAQACDAAGAISLTNEKPTPPELIRRFQPQYPSQAKEKRVQGTVKLSALIDKSGAIEDLRLRSGPFLLYPAAVDAVRRWQYRAGSVNNHTVDTFITMEVSFTLLR